MLLKTLADLIALSGTTFLRLLLLWRGSVWKHVLRDLLIWSLGCITLALIYMLFIRTESPDRGQYCSVLAHMDNLPFMGTLSLLLGFTAQTTMKRWMDVYWLLVWPENAAIMFNSFFYENALPPDKARVVRHSVYRYLLLTYILLLRDVSIPVRKQFPTYNHLIEGKLLTEEELDVMEHANIAENSPRYWHPMLWTVLVLKKYYRSPLSMSTTQRSAMDEVHFGKLVEELSRMRGKLGDILSYDWVPIPLASTQLSRMRGKLGDILSYDWVPIPLASTQTITFAVYCYLVINGILQHYPLCLYTSDWSVMSWATRFAFSLLLNTFYLGWLKCSQVMVNPFGLDDDDFEAGALVDMYQRSLAAILTRPEGSQPVVKRIYPKLPHTVASALIGGVSETSLVGSMANKAMPKLGQEVVKRS